MQSGVEGDDRVHHALAGNRMQQSPGEGIDRTLGLVEEVCSQRAVHDDAESLGAAERDAAVVG
jgi:hypothetical protein